MAFLTDFFSVKQLDSIRNSNSKINVWEGSIRSGKTHASLWRFVDEASVGPDGDFAIITRTYDSFERNILPELYKILGGYVRFFRGKRQLFIKNRKCHVISADDSSAEAKIRGPTFASAYVDEVTIIPETVFKMLIGRLSIAGAKLFCTTNPDSPYHWFKVLLDGNPDVTVFKFTMEDNPSLEKDYKDYIRRQYKGLWYQRFIEGLWVQAEGAIYDQFDEKLHIIDFPLSTATSYIVGVDYGTSNPCAFVLIGHNPSYYPNLWVEEEYYFNSKTAQRQKTDYEYAEDLKNFISQKPIKAIYIDPSAVSFRVELQKQGISNLYEAKNDVGDGIRFVSNYLNTGALKICRSCTNLIKEFQSYLWDPKCAKTGVDKPLKENDHCLDSLRYALYTHFFGKDMGSLGAGELERLYLESRGLTPDLPRFFQDPIDPNYQGMRF